MHAWELAHVHDRARAHLSERGFPLVSFAEITVVQVSCRNECFAAEANRLCFCSLCSALKVMAGKIISAHAKHTLKQMRAHTPNRKRRCAIKKNLKLSSAPCDSLNVTESNSENLH